MECYTCEDHGIIQRLWIWCGTQKLDALICADLVINSHDSLGFVSTTLHGWQLAHAHLGESPKSSQISASNPNFFLGVCYELFIFIDSRPLWWHIKSTIAKMWMELFCVCTLPPYLMGDVITGHNHLNPPSGLWYAFPFNWFNLSQLPFDFGCFL